jgi:hypothetical protein
VTRKSRPCRHCGARFGGDVIRRGQRYCSATCQRSNANAVRKSRIASKPTLSCSLCGSTFVPKKRTANGRPIRYCSVACNQRARNLAVRAHPSDRNCARCGVAFASIGKRKYCTVRCRERENYERKCRDGRLLRQKDRARANRLATEWRRLNPERAAAVKARYRARPIARQHEREYGRSWYAAHKDECAVKNRGWYLRVRAVRASGWAERQWRRMVERRFGPAIWGRPDLLEMLQLLRTFRRNGSGRTETVCE